jgi:CheY-like chemotaxis protein
VQWQRASDGGVELSWAETGGPLVEQPKRRGFGSTLIERALGMETGGRAMVHDMRAGVVCDIFLPAASVLYANTTAESHGTQQSDIRVAAENVPLAEADAFRILLVEDSFLLVLTLQSMLDELGWIVVGPATRRGEALEMAKSHVFDAALLDVNLDGEMSWDVASLLKERDIPFVFSTGYDVSNVLPDAFAGSVVIAKPYQSRDVEQRLREVIAAKRRRLSVTPLA